MGYSVKWVGDNLGITRDMLRYYEKEKLLPVAETRNPSNKYRDYSEEDIKRIWGIKLLIGIGFSVKEIRAFDNEPEFSFYDAISEKVKQLEKKYDEIQLYLQFAKTIKLTGRIPNTTQIGNMKFDDFIEYARRNWNAFGDLLGEKYMTMADAFLRETTGEWQEADLHRIMELFSDIEPEQIACAQTLSGYYRVIVDMMPLGYDNDAVQNVVKCLYAYTLSSIEPQYREKLTPPYFADHTCSNFIESDLAKMNEHNYGKDGCIFIAKALAYFGGVDLGA